MRRVVDDAPSAWACLGCRGRRRYVAWCVFADSTHPTRLGMAQYETRSWIGWHHHMSLVVMAHLFITLTQRDLKKHPS